MKTKINDTNFEAINDLMLKISCRRKDIADLTQAMEDYSEQRGVHSFGITLCAGTSYQREVRLLQNNFGEFVKVIIPAIIGVLQAEIDNLYKEIDKL